MSEPSAYEIALNKGERFLERDNFLLAKRELEIAQRLRPSAALAAKMHQCEAGIIAHNAKEAVKKGRKLEKKGKFAEALKQFEQAQVTSSEDWLNQKIEALRQQIKHDAVVTTIEHAERKNDWSALLVTYEQASATAELSDTEQQALNEKKLIALVQLGRYAEAQAQARDHPPLGTNARYHLGYAQAACGAYLQALNLWLTLLPTNPTLRPQIITLIPLAYREMNESAANVPTDLYAQLLSQLKNEAALTPLLPHFKLHTIDTLWRQGKYREAAQPMLPLPPQLSLAGIGFYARLLLQLAEEDIEQLPIAISLWLTAIHNTPLLKRLAVHQTVSTPIQIETLRGTLQQELENLLERYDKKGLLSKRLQSHYQTEKRIIETFTNWALTCEAEVWPCTQAFAARFGLSSAVLAHIEAWRERDTWDESILTVAVYFSASGHSLLLAEAGAIDEALTALPKVTSNDTLNTYCRQRIAWICGIDRALAGNTKGKTYLIEASPLLIAYPHYRKELIDIALGERPLKERFGLIDALEWLARQLNDAEFREATANLLCQKAIFLANHGSSNAVYKRLVDQAAALCPDCYAIKNTYAQFNKVENQEQLYKALHRGKLSSAVAIIKRSNGDDTLIEIFFSILDYSFRRLEDKDIESHVRLANMRDFLFHAQQVDPNHPLNSIIANEITFLENEKQQ